MSMRPVTLTFLGAAGTVTGSKYLLTIGERKVLVDAGMFQGEKQWRSKNREPFPVNPGSIGDVLLTHAHTDHVAYLPALVRHGFRGEVWCTEGTRRLAEIVLRDAARLQEQAAEEAKAGGWSKHADPTPLYTTVDAEAALRLFRTVEFDAPVDVGDGLVAEWTRAGHILGSASVRVEVDGASVLFSGDLGRHDHPILRDRDIPRGADVVLCESTYGDREHPEPDLSHEPLADAIRRTVERGGQVVIPAFAIDRTETVLQALTQLLREGRIPDVPVVVDGPMALAALDVYRDPDLDELGEGVTVADFTGVDLSEARTQEESKALNRRREPMVIVSSSGMAEGGRVLHHLARLLPGRQHCVVLTGYQAVGTRGRSLEDGAKSVKINGRYIPVHAEIVRDNEFSVHGDASDLLDWLRPLPKRHRVPDTLFVVHGERDVAGRFAGRVEDELGWNCVVPRYGEVVSLLPDPYADPDPDEAAEAAEVAAESGYAVGAGTEDPVAAPGESGESGESAVGAAPGDGGDAGDAGISGESGTPSPSPDGWTAPADSALSQVLAESGLASPAAGPGGSQPADDDPDHGVGTGAQQVAVPPPPPPPGG